MTGGVTFLRWLGVLLAATVLMLSPAGAADLRLVAVDETPTLAPPAPDYRVPTDPGTVFYVQRSMNPNTVVYAARFQANGKLEPDEPLVAFWRRFNNEGELKELSFIERRFAYGVKTSRRADGTFDVRFRALPDLNFVLEQTGPRRAVLTFAGHGERIVVDHAYLEIDESGLIPSVVGLKLYGRRDGGHPVELVYSVTGGSIG